MTPARSHWTLQHSSPRGGEPSPSSGVAQAPPIPQNQGAHSVLPGLGAPALGGGGGGSGRRSVVPGARAQCIPVDGLGSARWLSPPPPTSSWLAVGNLGPRRCPEHPPTRARRVTARGPPAPHLDNSALLGRRPPEAGAEAEAPSRKSKVCPKGSSRHPTPAGSGSAPPSPVDLEPGTQTSPGALPRLLLCLDGGVPGSRSPKTRLPSQLPASCARPVGPEVTDKQRDGQLQARRPPGRGGQAERPFGFAFLQLRVPSSPPGAASPGFPRQPRPPPRVHGPPRPAPRSEPRAVPCAAAELRVPDSSTHPAPGAPGWPLARSGKGSLHWPHRGERPSARHPRTHPPAPRRRPGRSPES